MGETAATGRFTFGRCHRVRRRRDFARAFAAKCSVADDRLVVYVHENDEQVTRLGLVVGRKVGNAVRRNRVKRLLREAFRLSRHELPVGYDVLCIPRVGREPRLEDYKASLRRLVKAGVGKLANRRRRSGRSGPRGDGDGAGG